MVTGAPLAAVHNAIDSRLVRPRPARSSAAVRRLLTIQRSPEKERLSVADGTALRIEVGTARRKAERQLNRLARLREMVVCDLGIMAAKGHRYPWILSPTCWLRGQQWKRFSKAIRP